MDENVSDIPVTPDPPSTESSGKRLGTTKYLKLENRGPFKVKVKSIDIKKYFEERTGKEYAPSFQFGWINAPAVAHPRKNKDGKLERNPQKVRIATYAKLNIFGEGLPMRNAYQEIYEAVAGVGRGKSFRFNCERPRKVNAELLKSTYGHSTLNSRLSSYNKKFRDQMKKIALKKDNKKLVSNLAEDIVELYKRIIDKWVAPKNSPYTISQKGRDDPLVDKGYMRDNVTFRLKPARK